MIKQIGSETVRETVSGEQCTVRPGKDGYFEDDRGNQYELMVAHNGEEWTAYLRNVLRGDYDD